MSRLDTLARKRLAMKAFSPLDRRAALERRISSVARKTAKLSRCQGVL